jgi:hypothetical protein
MWQEFLSMLLLGTLRARLPLHMPPDTYLLEMRSVLLTTVAYIPIFLLPQLASLER